MRSAFHNLILAALLLSHAPSLAADSGSSGGGNNTEQASQSQAQAAAQSGMSCIMMLNMARKMDDKALKDMAMMMAMQQCSQASQFQSASKKNKDNAELMKTAAETTKVQQLTQPEALKTADVPKDVKVEGLTIDESVSKRGNAADDFAIPTPDVKAEATQVAKQEEAPPEAPQRFISDAKTTLNPIGPDRGNNGRDPSSLPSGANPFDRPGGGMGGGGGIAALPNGLGGGKAESGKAGTVGESGAGEESKRAITSSEPSGGGGGGGGSEGGGSSGGGGSDPLADLLAKLNAGPGENEEGFVQQVVDFPRLKKKVPLTNLFEFARFRYEYATYKEKRLRIFTKRELEKRKSVKTAFSEAKLPK